MIYRNQFANCIYDCVQQNNVIFIGETEMIKFIDVHPIHFVYLSYYFLLSTLLVIFEMMTKQAPMDLEKNRLEQLVNLSTLLIT